MYLCILDQAGSVVLHREVPAEPAAFLDAIAPFRDGLVVACECLFCWYSLADLCQAENIAFVLGHALHMKAIHGGKAADDRIDSSKIAHLVRGGNLPIAYAHATGPDLDRLIARAHGEGADRGHSRFLNVPCLARRIGVPVVCGDWIVQVLRRNRATQL
jgi:hypothetical protein